MRRLCVLVSVRSVLCARCCLTTSDSLLPRLSGASCIQAIANRSSFKAGVGGDPPLPGWRGALGWHSVSDLVSAHSLRPLLPDKSFDSLLPRLSGASCTQAIANRYSFKAYCRTVGRAGYHRGTPPYITGLKTGQHRTCVHMVLSRMDRTSPDTDRTFRTGFRTPSRTPPDSGPDSGPDTNRTATGHHRTCRTTGQSGLSHVQSHRCPCQ